MRIPKRLSYILERDQSLDGLVKTAVSEFEPWIKHSNLPFFPEYTDHGIEHIEAVLRTATGLIRDEAWESVTPSDAAVLILAVLLHDCAMHLREDGFLALLHSERSNKLIPMMKDQPWNLLWEEFYSEATRFDGRQLLRLFGDTQPVHRPQMEPNALTKRDRMLIGEFLRRHHPRLAHEIAIFGVPTPRENPLLLGSFREHNVHIAQLAGLVARSHGSDIRSFFPVLRDEFDIRQFKGAHPVILMVLLRVADYLQVDAERAPAQMLQVTRLASPVSQGEWKAHHAIKDIRHTHEDPEAIFIDAHPKDVQTFLRVQGWVEGIQKELDTSWAVLGEVYGRYEGLKNFGPVLRRIRSSLDDVEAFSQRVNYLPIKATFRAADADLLKLLIAPLYGNLPEVGMRELIQNAVDACRELQEHCRCINPPLPSERPIQDEDVIVRVERDTNDQIWVTISDKGIGMTPEVVINYFLTAGASFRRSESWRKVFEDEEGRSKVLRAGRFGVGALAAFLLGSEIEVATRHVDQAHGHLFVASVESDSIELLRHNRPIGTTIRIRVSEHIAKRLSESAYNKSAGYLWDWYCFSTPSVARILDGQRLEQEHSVPILQDEVLSEWHRILHPDFAGILWSYRKAPQLVCNGIIVKPVGDRYFDPTIHGFKKGSGLTCPNLVVFDPDGNLPLNLQRTALAEERLPFEDELLDSISHDFVAYSLACGPTKTPTTLELVRAFGEFSYFGSCRGNYLEHGKPAEDWYVTANGFGYLDPNSLQHQKSALVLRVSDESDYSLPFTIPKSQIVIPLQGDQTLTGQDRWVRFILDLGFFETTNSLYSSVESGGAGIFDLLKRIGSRILVSTKSFKRLSNTLPKYLSSRLRTEGTLEEWCLLSIGNCPEPEFDFSGYIQQIGGALNGFSSISEVYLGEQKDNKPLPVTKAWRSLLGEAVIPFSVPARKTKFSETYQKLEGQIEQHSSTKSKD